MPQKCPQCETSLEETAVFCSQCGFKVGPKDSLPTESDSSEQNVSEVTESQTDISDDIFVADAVDEISSGSNANLQLKDEEYREGITFVDSQAANEIAEALPDSTSAIVSNPDQTEQVKKVPEFVEESNSIDSPNPASGVTHRVGSPFKQGDGITLSKPPILNKQLAASMILLPEYENFRACGGAVGSLVLGIFAIVGIIFTPWALINSTIGMFMGLWGLGSRKFRMAQVGMVLCCVPLLPIAFNFFFTIYKMATTTPAVN